MRFKDFKVTLYILGSIVAALGIMYLLMTLFYSQRFFKGTIINGTDVSTMTVFEANRVLVDESEDPVFTVVNKDESEKINGSSLNLKISYIDDLTELKKTQNPFLWYLYLYISKEYTASNKVVSDRDKLAEELSKLSILNAANNNADVFIRIVRGRDGFELLDTTVEPIDFKKLANKLSNAILSKEYTISCEDCYIEKTYTLEQQRVLEEFELLDKVQNNSIRYVDGDISCTAGKPVVSKWIEVDDNNYPSFDANGNVILNEERVLEYINMMSKLFNTGSEEGIEWTKHDGGKVMVKPCYTYDVYEVNQEAELNQIKLDLTRGEPVERKPVYLTEGNREADSNPKTYVEVDMGLQKMYFFKDGKLELESDCVTGLLTDKDRKTPACMAHIYFKQKDRTLRGPGYESFVHYWMAFNKGVGLHDASWRHGKFGGDIYKRSGSHGCVNLPTDVASQLYDLIDKGTLVVTYY